MTGRALFPAESRQACTHSSLDDDRLYRFVRDTRLPLGTFDTDWRLTPTVALFALTLVLAVAMLIAAVTA